MTEDKTRLRLCISCARAELRKGMGVEVGLYCATKAADVLAVRSQKAVRVPLADTCERWEQWSCPDGSGQVKNLE